MSKANALAGLIGSYGDSGDESDDGPAPAKKTHTLASESATFQHAAYAQGINTGASATIHPAPIPHCPWSACYDETSGFTYYWNQQTNAVTWEAPPEYLLALKLAQQQLNAQGSAEVSAEEWHLYQQALAEKQHTKVISKPAVKKPGKPIKCEPDRNSRNNKKRRYSDDEDDKIELITSYHNSDSESDHEPESPVKKPTTAPPLPPPVQKPVKPKTPKTPKIPHKKAKTKSVEFGPMLPPNQNYSAPIGPEMPKELSNNKPKLPEVTVENGVKEKKVTKNDTEENQDENLLLKKLKDKAKILENLGGELPSGLEKIIREEIRSGTASPAKSEDKKSLDIDDLLEEIEKKELPKISKAKKIDMFDEDSKSSIDSPRNSPRSGIMTPKSGINTPIETQALFPSSKNIDDTASTLFPSASTSLFPSAGIIEEEKESKPEQPPLPPEPKANVYLSDPSEIIEKPSKKKLRISNSVLPERKKAEPASYTTKYSQHIEGFSTERVGLGFTKEEDSTESSKSANTISYGKGLMFTKGETLNEEKKDDDLDELTELVEAKLKYLNQVQPGMVSPVQEMLIQMQTLVSAFRFGALAGAYWRRWARSAAAALAEHERAAAPPGWACAFQRYAHTPPGHAPRPAARRPAPRAPCAPLSVAIHCGMPSRFLKHLLLDELSLPVLGIRRPRATCSPLSVAMLCGMPDRVMMLSLLIDELSLAVYFPGVRRPRATCAPLSAAIPCELPCRYTIRDVDELALTVLGIRPPRMTCTPLSGAIPCGMPCRFMTRLICLDELSLNVLDIRRPRVNCAPLSVSVDYGVPYRYMTRFRPVDDISLNASGLRPRLRWLSEARDSGIPHRRTFYYHRAVG